MSYINPLPPWRDPKFQLRFAKSIAPEIFEKPTPQFHLKLLSFLNGEMNQKSIVIFRNGGKTTLLTNISVIVRIFFENEPYIQIVSENAKKAKAFLKEIKRVTLRMQDMGFDIRRAADVDVEAKWNDKEAQILCNGKGSMVQAFGSEEDPRGYKFEHYRPTLIILDDIENKEGQQTSQQREKLRDKIFADLLPGLHTELGEVWNIGTITHEESILNNCIKSTFWDSIVFPISDGERLAWRSRFPQDKLDKIRNELYENGQEDVWAQEYLCIAQSKEKQLFKRESYRYFSHVRYGEEKVLFEWKDSIEKTYEWVRVPEAIVFDDGSELLVKDCFCYSMMDLASTGKDRTAIITCLIDSSRNIYVADIQAGHWTPYQKCVAVLECEMAWHPLKFGIEKGGMQNEFFYTIDAAMRETGIKVNIEPIAHGNRAKNIRISRLEPHYKAQKIWHNRNHRFTPELEAELGAFQLDIESMRDDLIDAFSDVTEFVQGRSFAKVEQFSNRGLYF